MTPCILCHLVNVLYCQCKVYENKNTSRMYPLRYPCVSLYTLSPSLSSQGREHKKAIDRLVVDFPLIGWQEGLHSAILYITCSRLRPTQVLCYLLIKCQCPVWQVSWFCIKWFIFNLSQCPCVSSAAVPWEAPAWSTHKCVVTASKEEAWSTFLQGPSLFYISTYILIHSSLRSKAQYTGKWMHCVCGWKTKSHMSLLETCLVSICLV